MKRVDHVAVPIGKSTDGNTVVQVKLASGQTVTLHEDDFKDLQKRGLGGGWYCTTDGNGRSYIVLTMKRNGRRVLTTLARAILSVDGAKLQVNYKNKNHFDLTRNNLICVTLHNSLVKQALTAHKPHLRLQPNAVFRDSSGQLQQKQNGEII